MPPRPGIGVNASVPPPTGRAKISNFGSSSLIPVASIPHSPADKTKIVPTCGGRGRRGALRCGVSRIRPSRHDRHTQPRLSGSRPQIPPGNLCRSGRSGCHGAHPEKRVRGRPDCTSLHHDRHPRHRQNHHSADHRQGHELHRPGRKRWPHHRTLRPVRTLRGHHGRPPCRRDGDGRRLPHRRQRYPRDHRQRPLPRRLGPLQDLYHRRGPHALDQRFQRAAQDTGGTARACEIHLRHHRDSQGAGDGPVALPAVRPAPDRTRRHDRPAAQDRKCRGRADRR